jgi:DNA-binding MarR family transcriptional regulator
MFEIKIFDLKLNTLVRDGLVERRPDETDRRVVRLCGRPVA